METKQEMKQRNWKDVYEWFVKIANSDAGKIENLSDRGYDNWLLSLFSLAGVDKIDLVMGKKDGVEVIQSVIELAYHEAGHAIFVWRRYWYYEHYGIALNPQNRAGLCTQTWMMNKVKDDMELSHLSDHLGAVCGVEGSESIPYYSHADIEFLLAGIAAENRFCSLYSIRPSKLEYYISDYDYVTWLVKIVHGAEGIEAKKIIRNTYRNVSRVLKHPKTWASVKAIAEALLIHNYLDHKAASEIISQINPPRQARTQ